MVRNDYVNLRKHDSYSTSTADIDVLRDHFCAIYQMTYKIHYEKTKRTMFNSPFDFIKPYKLIITPLIKRLSKNDVILILNKFL